jgi:hypothetical protein
MFFIVCQVCKLGSKASQHCTQYNTSEVRSEVFTVMKPYMASEPQRPQHESMCASG